VFPRNRHTVLEAIIAMQTCLPFTLLGLDSDNGSEFISLTLLDYCLYNKITFILLDLITRMIRLMSKKNWYVVRHTVGYDHFETTAQYNLLQSIYYA